MPGSPATAPLARSTDRCSAGVVMLLACAALWSLNGLIVKLASADPITFAGLRSAVAAAFVLLCLPLFRGNRPNWGSMLASVLLHTAMVGFFIAAITFGRAASGVILQYTGPAWVALIAWGLQRQKIGRRSIAAIVLTLIGVAVMLIMPILADPTVDLIGPACGLAAGISFGALVVMLEKVDRDAGGANPILVVFINNAGTALLLLPVAVAQGRFELTPYQWQLILFCGIVQHAAAYLLFQFGLRRVRPVEASLLILLEPLLSPTWVAIFIGEYPTRWDWVGGIAIFAALILEATKRNHNPAANHPPD